MKLHILRAANNTIGHPGKNDKIPIPFKIHMETAIARQNHSLSRILISEAYDFYKSIVTQQ
jgi:hypothetical protein